MLVREKVRVVTKHLPDGTPVEKERVQVVIKHCDIIGQAFWEEHPQILAP